MRRGIRQHRYDTANDASIGRARRTFASWLGLFLLLTNVLGGGMLPARSAEAGAAPFTQDLLSDRIVVCTAAGMVVMDRDGNVIAQQGEHAGHDDICVFCLPLMHGSIQAPVLIADMVAPTIKADVEPAYLEPFALRPVRLDGAHSPRAPPLA